MKQSANIFTNVKAMR